MVAPLTECALCVRLQRAEAFSSLGSAAALYDSFPVFPGHMLVVSRRHVESILALDPQEQLDALRLVQRLASELGAFNLGLNDSAPAGQTVKHCHIHVIPRQPGDVADPRGGVRWLNPATAKYWSA